MQYDDEKRQSEKPEFRSVQSPSKANPHAIFKSDPRELFLSMRISEDGSTEASKSDDSLTLSGDESEDNSVVRDSLQSLIGGVIEDTVNTKLSQRIPKTDVSTNLMRNRSQTLATISSQEENAPRKISDELVKRDQQKIFDVNSLEEILKMEGNRMKLFTENDRIPSDTSSTEAIIGSKEKFPESNEAEILSDESLEEQQHEKKSIRITGVKINLSNSEESTQTVNEMLPNCSKESFYQKMRKPDSEQQVRRDSLEKVNNSIALPSVENIDQKMKKMPLLEVKLSSLNDDNSLLELQLSSGNLKMGVHNIGISESPVIINPVSIFTDDNKLETVSLNQKSSARISRDDYFPTMNSDNNFLNTQAQKELLAVEAQRHFDFKNGFNASYSNQTKENVDKTHVDNLISRDPETVESKLIQRFQQLPDNIFEDFLRDRRSQHSQTELPTLEKYHSISTQTEKYIDSATPTEKSIQDYSKPKTSEMSTDTVDFDEYLLSVNENEISRVLPANVQRLHGQPSPEVAERMSLTDKVRAEIASEMTLKTDANRFQSAKDLDQESESALPSHLPLLLCSKPSSEKTQTLYSADMIEHYLNPRDISDIINPSAATLNPIPKKVTLTFTTQQRDEMPPKGQSKVRPRSYSFEERELPEYKVDDHTSIETVDKGISPKVSDSAQIRFMSSLPSESESVVLSPFSNPNSASSIKGYVETISLCEQCFEKLSAAMLEKERIQSSSREDQVKEHGDGAESSDSGSEGFNVDDYQESISGESHGAAVLEKSISDSVIGRQRNLDCSDLRQVFSETDAIEMRRLESIYEEEELAALLPEVKKRMFFEPSEEVPASQKVQVAETSRAINCIDIADVRQRLSSAKYECSSSDRDSFRNGDFRQCSRTASDAKFIQSLKTIDLDEHCEVIHNHLVNQVIEDEEQLKTSVTVLLRKWFKVAAAKDANIKEVRNYLRYFNDFSEELMKCVINFVDIADENSILHYAFFNSRFDIAEEVLKTGLATPLLNKPNKMGVTPMTICAMSHPQTGDDWFVVQRTMELGNVNCRALKSGQTPLMNAVCQESEAMVQLLLACGADPGLQDEDGSTALMFAAANGHVPCAKLLLEHPGCNPSVADYEGATACSIALEAGYTDVGLLIYFRSTEEKANKTPPIFSPKQNQKRLSKSTASEKNPVKNAIPKKISTPNRNRSLFQRSNRDRR